MSNRGRRGSMRGGGFSGGRGRGRGNAVSEAIRAPSSTTSMTLHERFSSVKPKAGRGQDAEGDSSPYGSKKNQQLVARLQARAESRQQRGRGGQARRGRGAPSPNFAKVERAREIAEALQNARGLRDQPGTHAGTRGRGLLRGISRSGARSSRGASTQGRGPTTQGRGPTSQGRGRGADGTRGRGLSRRGASTGRGGSATGTVNRGRGSQFRRGAVRGASRGAARGAARLRHPGDRPMRGGVGMRGRGRGRGGLRGRGGRGASSPVTREQLDSEMDSYMSESKVNIINFD